MSVIPPRKPTRHESHCIICSHPRRQEIEDDYVAWKSPAIIVLDYKLSNRSLVYRHAAATGLDLKRARNIRAALERIVERVDDVDVTAASVVQASALIARINTRGELVPEDERITGHDLFAKMSSSELARYAKDGTVPNWFPGSAHVKNPQNSGGDENA
jgi:hypothetical protein